MKIKNTLIILVIGAFCCMTCACTNKDKKLAEEIKNNEYFIFVKQKALEIMKTGFNAGDGYREVWIRDYNTFIELAAEVFPAEELKENLLVFFRMQGSDGNIIDGFTPAELIGEDKTDFIYCELETRYAGHKNTVETDQESSLVQAVSKYIKITGDKSILDEIIGGKPVSERLADAMDYLLEFRFNDEYGLITGATTADWGDVQPERGWGVDLDDNTHPAIDIYDNAMFIIALDNLMEMIPAYRDKYGTVRSNLAENTRKHLWDPVSQKFIPHIYLDRGSPFPPDFDENQIYYFGGTAVAIEAGLLTPDEVLASLVEMKRRVELAGAASIGLTLYPPYPEGFFENKIMNPEYSYQNGGDWTWFGGRMIQQLISYGFIKEAYEEVLPMVRRVRDNDGFYEWYSRNNEPRGSGTFRGEAGVLYKAITMFERWAEGL
ncbi:MAG TPA: hypothetical protein PLI41_08710 [Bacteroidales bacterium]|nr:hypothetical protein [Bacteroidales bacterium]